MNLLEITMETAVVGELESFYLEKIGLAPGTAPRRGTAFQVGPCQLRFRPAQGATMPYYHFAFNISENRIEDAANWLEERGIELLPFKGKRILDFPNWNAHALYFYDPAGNIAEFIARHDLPTASSGPFGPHDIFSVSEMAFVANDIPALAQGIETGIGVSVWEKSAVESNFAALGNNHGLFILSADSRNWLPTQDPCRVFPTDVVVKGDAERTWAPEGLPYSFRTKVG